MPRLTIDGISVDVAAGTTVLEAARFLGLEIPTLCHEEGLTPWGACRLCLVEIGQEGRTKLVASCTYLAEEGLVVRTSTKRVVQARKMVLELLISMCPSSKRLQDIAAKMGLEGVRFSPKNKDCIFCGLCVRICEEQMMAKAIGFAGRGDKLRITTPFDKTSDICRRCGACMYICPVCTLRCEGPNAENVYCGRCNNELQPTCTEEYDNYNCWMGLKGECGTCVREK